MAFGTTSEFRRFSCLLALVWTLLPILSAAQCVHALPLPQRAAAAKPQTAPRCPICAKMASGGMQMAGMQMAGMQMPAQTMPGMAGLKCCCHSGGLPMCCRCGVQPAPKPAAVMVALVWSPHALLPASVRLLPPLSASCTYPSLFSPLLTFCRTPLPRPPRLL